MTHHQSLPLCILYSVASGCCRVVATMVLAYPDFCEKQRIAAAATSADGEHKESDENDVLPTTTPKHYYLAAHLTLLLVCAILSIYGAMYGPVSLAVPVQTAANLLTNVAVMSLILRMRTFDKAQRTGTYVVFFSVLSLVKQKAEKPNR